MSKEQSVPETITVVVLLVLFCYLQVFVHEREHARECMKHGFRPTELMVGCPIPFMSFLRIRIHHPGVLDGVPVSIYPLLLGGVARIDDVQAACFLNCSLRVQMPIFSAGIWANLFYTCCACVVYALCVGKLRMLAVFAGMALVFWLGKRILLMYVLPIVSVAGTFVLPNMVLGLLLKPPRTNLTVTHVVSSMWTNGLTVAQGIEAAAFIGFGFAVANLLPLVPLDGGQLVQLLLRKWSRSASSAYIAVTSVLLLCLLLHTLWAEILAIHSLR